MPKKKIDPHRQEMTRQDPEVRRHNFDEVALAAMQETSLYRRVSR